MIIHVVQSGETIHSISEYYNISAERLIIENGITNPGKFGNWSNHINCTA